jgi:hypothetical protein
MKTLDLNVDSSSVADMCQDDPAKRPKMNEVVTLFDEIVRNLGSWKRS